MRLPGRLEWKILSAVFLAAGVSSLVAAYGVRFALARFTAFAERHEEEVGGAAARAADVFRAYFTQRKDHFRQRAQSLAAMRPATMASLAGEPDLLRARLLDGERVVDEWHADDAQAGMMRESPSVLAPLPAGPGAGQPRLLELTFGIPRELYANFLALRESLDREKELGRAYGAFAPEFARQYFLLMLAVLSATPVLGLWFARRTTRRVARLAEAARRVGEGDLSVRVAPRGKDELDALGRAFDAMVSELDDARARVAYMQKVSAWQEVARRLAHEIKNPLTPIQLAVQELVSKYKGDDPGYRRLLDTASEILREEITSLRRLVDDFSAFARLSSAEPESLDISVLVSDFVRQHPEWQSRVHVEAPLPSIKGRVDKTLFRRVLANLIENGLQAAAATGVEPLVELRVEGRAERRRVAIIVDDNGPGVPAAERQRIFDPYVTTKQGGTGLGLAIVRKIVIDHGGDVRVDPAPAPCGGARFVVEIPEE